MERDALSFRQLMALFWAGLLGPAAELLPGYSAQAGVAGGLTVAAAGAGAFLGGWAFWRLSAPEGGVAQGILDRTGKVLGRVILLLYMVWGGVLVTVRLRSCAQRLLGSGQRDGAVWFFLLALGGMALWMGRGQLGALGRAGELMFAALLLTGGIVLALGLLQVRGENLMTRWTWSVAEGARVLWPGLSVFGYGLFTAFLLQPREMEGAKRHWLGWMIGGCLVLALAQTILLGCFGAQLTQRLSSPFFQLAKSVGIDGGFQRVESVVSAIWIFGDLILLSSILWAVGRIAGRAFPRLEPKAVVTVTAVLAMVAGLALFGERLPLERAAAVFVPAGSGIFGLVLPVLLAAGTRAPGRKKG